MNSELAAMFPSIPAEDIQRLRAYTSGHLDERWGLGQRPGVLVIDMTNAFVADEASSAFVPDGMRCAEAIATLLERTRRAGMPTFYTRGSPFSTEAEAGAWLRGRGMSVLDTVNTERHHEIVAALQPGAEDVIITKEKPSGFFGTQLHSVLNYCGVDTVIVTGVTTSGCIRATVNDAFSLNYRVVVPVDCVADRSAISHEVELFDMGAKYADLVTSGALVEQVNAA